MTALTGTHEDPSDKTIFGRPCPRCKAVNVIEKLAQQGYACQQCGFELAYLDYTATGGVRQVLGWVRDVGAIIHDRYRVESVLGRGGFGSTYLVSDLRLNNRRRALKEIPPNMFDDREPMLLSKLVHPGIPDITDRFEYDGLICLVLEFGGTQTIESKRKEFGGKIPLPLLLPWLGQLCEVLLYLHTHQPPIIHRDLKPANILLDEYERVRLIDFGIAKVANPTEATHTLGRAVSYGFSSPEQVTGAGTDHRSDIYGLGATAYFLLTGVHPPNLSDRLSDKTVKRLADLEPGIPPELDRAITQSLELNPEKRQQSIKEFGDLFLSLAPSTKFSAEPRQQSDKGASGQKPTLMAVVALTVLAVAAGAFYYWQKEGGPREAKLTVPVAKVEPSPLPAVVPKERKETVTVPPPVPSSQTKEGATVPLPQELPQQSAIEKKTIPAEPLQLTPASPPSPERETLPAMSQVAPVATAPPPSHIREEMPPGQTTTSKVLPKQRGLSEGTSTPTDNKSAAEPLKSIRKPSPAPAKPVPVAQVTTPVNKPKTADPHPVLSSQPPAAGPASGTQVTSGSANCTSLLKKWQLGDSNSMQRYRQECIH